jgi:hypothetical protein
VTRAILGGAKSRIGDADVYMPPFGQGYTDTEVAALASQFLVTTVCSSEGFA